MSDTAAIDAQPSRLRWRTGANPKRRNIDVRHTLTEHGDMLTTRELAEYLGISIWTLYKWNAANIGPQRIVVGGKCLYPREGVVAWLSDREVA